MLNFLRHLLGCPQWIPLGLVMLLGLFIGLAQANEIEIPGKSWADDLTYFTHDTCTADTRTNIHEAAQEAQQYSVGITHAGVAAAYERDGQNTIGCAIDSPFVSSLQNSQTDGARYEDHHLVLNIRAQVFILGTARTWSYPETGEIVEFDIWLNPLWQQSERWGMQTIKHEWGHALGLPHSQYGESLMAPANGAQDWDIESIAKLALLYSRCESRADDNLHLWIPNITVLDPDTEKLRDVYAVLPAGAVWPDDVFWYGNAVCE